MKLLVPGLAGLMLSAALSVGCGPGLSHHAKAPEAPDAEPAHAIIGTTTVTSADDALPLPRRPLESWDGAPPAVVAATPTWGAGGATVGEP